MVLVRAYPALTTRAFPLYLTQQLRNITRYSGRTATPSSIR